MAEDNPGMSGFGTTISGSVTGAFAEVTRIQHSGSEVGDIDITTMNTPDGWRKFVAGLKDAKELQLDLLYECNNYDTINGDLGLSQTFTITLPDGSTFVCVGYLKSLGLQVPMEDKMTSPATIKLSGKPTFNSAS